MNRLPSITRRTFLVLATGAGLTACGQKAVFDTVEMAYRGTIGEFPDIPVSPEQVRQAPYAMLYTKLGTGPRSIVVLAVADRTGLHWMSADRRALVTRRGRLVAITGFAGNLRGTMFTRPDPLPTMPRATGPVETVRTIDMSFQGLVGLPVTAVLRPIGPEAVTIVGTTHDTLRVEETCRCEELRWDFQNTFWVDRATGFVWKSVQHATPYLPPFDIEVLKPFGDPNA